MNTTDAFVSLLPDWQKTNLLLFRDIIYTVHPSVVEDLKWNVPVFLIDGKIIFAMSAFKKHTKFNFIANGASLTDPAKLFNNGLDSKRSRSIDLCEGDPINTDELQDLVSAAFKCL